MTIKLTWLPAVIAVATLGVAHQSLAETTDQLCAKGPDVRRIEIKLSNGGDLPCKVVYRPDVDSDTLGIVSWQDIPSLDACVAQAQEVVDRLTVEGWTCAEAAQTATQAGNQGSGSVSELSDRNPPLFARAEDIRIEENPNVDGPALPSEVSPSLVQGEDKVDQGEFDEPARFVENPDIAPPSEDLASLIENDLDQLDTTLDGILEAKIAGYGDVNADDIDDALVLYTFTSPQPAYRQFLAIYTFDGEIYQLTATRPVSGNVSATMGAQIETIDQGVIHLSVQAFEPGDASCCPTGTRRLAIALRELDLVEIDADVPTR